jgi:hypothetical protein
MTDERPKTTKRRPKVEKLEVNRETVENLTEGEAAAAEGGIVVPGICAPRLTVGAACCPLTHLPK